MLTISGSGAMTDFQSAAAVPWAAVVDEVSAVTVASGVTLGKNALAGLPDEVLVTFGTPVMSVGSMKGATGASNPVIPDDQAIVAKSELQAAKAEAISVADGVVSLAVGVSSNANFQAETKDWKPVELTSGNVKVENGKVVISIPFDSASGFMILQSGDAKIGTAE